MKRVEVVLKHLSECEHCLCDNERDCYEFLCRAGVWTGRNITHWMRHPALPTGEAL